MTFLGRHLILTTLDEIPRSMRACPGHLAISHNELTALQAKDGETFKQLAAIVESEDAAEARQVFTYKHWKLRKSNRIAPSTRLAMLGAVTKSWHREKILA